MRGTFDPSLEIEIIRQIEFEIFKKVYFKYKILKFRQKLSYMAFINLMTINELILTSML